eukprot:TRINITY_DN15051_c0_g1_i4.p1 TRINITY_DN15051_c0_g1~~TRINITY_DN15051_c0_g1_i4.p1  ORF type:complete len:1044 (+),score=437.84 TRINITY_DN15051_c0_g1_i4:63-3194(+)
MSYGSPIRSVADKERLSVLRAELEDLDNVLGTPSSLGTPYRFENRHTSPVRSTPRDSASRPPTKPKHPEEKKVLLDNYEHVMSENAHVRRQVTYLSKEVASLSQPRRHHSASGTSGPPATSPRAVAKSPTNAEYAAMQRKTTSFSPSRVVPPGQAQDVPLDTILLDEVKQREAEVGQLEKRVSAATLKASQNYDFVKQANSVLRSVIQSTPTSAAEYMLLAQNVLEILDEVKGEEPLQGYDDRLRQRIDDHEQAKARILESRSAIDGMSLEDKVFHLQNLVAKYELAAVAGEGVKKQHTKKVMSLTRQLCDKQAEQALTDDALKQKADQLKGAHDALAHAAAQLAAVTDTTKELSRLQEEHQQLQQKLCAHDDVITARDRKIKNLMQEAEEKSDLLDKLRASETRCLELSETASRASNDVRALQNRVAEQDSHIQSLDADLAAHAEALDSARDQASDLSRLNDAARAELEKTRQHSTAASNDRSQIGKRIERLERELRESESRVINLTDQLHASVKETQHLGDSLKALATEHDATNLEFATTRASAESAREECISVKETLRAEQDEKGLLKRDLEVLRSKHASMVREHEDLLQKMVGKESLEAIHQEDLMKKDMQADMLMRRLSEREDELERRERLQASKDIELRKRLMSHTEREEKLQLMEKELISRRQELGHSVVSNTITTSKIVELSQLLESKEAELADLKSSNSVLMETVRSLEVDREQEMERTSQLEQVAEMVRGQLQENTLQFGALTEDLQSTRQRLETEMAQHELLDEQVRTLSDANVSLTAQAKHLEAESTRLSVAVETLELNLQRKSDALIQQKLDHENTLQFGALTEDLQSTRQRLETEMAQHELLDEQVRTLSDANVSLTAQAKHLEAESTRLSVAVETLELNLQRKSDALIQQKLDHENETAELHRRVSEGKAFGDQARHHEVLLQRSEKRAEDANREAVAVTTMMKEVQKELVHRQAQLDDSMRNSSNLWSAIARLGRKFDEHESNNTLRTNRPVHDKYEDACSFLRYIRGWWSMYRDKDPTMEYGASLS